MSTSKSGMTESSEGAQASDASALPAAPRARRPRGDRKYKHKASDLIQDADVRVLPCFILFTLFCIENYTWFGGMLRETQLTRTIVIINFLGDKYGVVSVCIWTK